MTQPVLSREALLEQIPGLRAFARGLLNDHDRADDLVQEAVLKAWSNLDKFKPGTNLRAWLFTILRNTYFSELRKRKREVEDADGAYAAALAVQPTQMIRVEFTEFRRALDKLSEDQREALVLVGAAGFSYEEAAEICGCAVGTIKSRVNRARGKLAELMGITGAQDLGQDPSVIAALGAVPLKATA